MFFSYVVRLLYRLSLSLELSNSLHLSPFLSLLTTVSPSFCFDWVVTFPMLMGYHHASKMLLLGRKYTAKEACKAGLVTSVVSGEDRLMEKVLKVTAKLAGHPPNGLIYSKRVCVCWRVGLFACVRVDVSNGELGCISKVR
jgi:Enoyl-CoA hydratase/isomerase